METRRFLKRWMIWLYLVMLDLAEVGENEAPQYTLCCALAILTLVASVLVPFMVDDARYLLLSIPVGFLLYLLLGLLLEFSSPKRSVTTPWQQSVAR